MNRYSPVFLDLNDKDVLVIGGGNIAFDKIKGLLRAQARITVVAKEVSPVVRALAKRGKIQLSLRPFKASDIVNRDLVYSATNDKRVSAEAARICKSKKIWINAVDQPEFCSFIVPAVVRMGDVTLAISTGGASPAFAKFLRMKIESSFGKEVGQMAALLKKHRNILMRIPMNERKRIVQRFLNERALSDMKAGRRAAVEKKLLEAASSPRGV